MALQSGQKPHITAHPLRKKVLRWSLVAVLSLLTLEFLVYFGSNVFLAGIAREEINKSTNGVYQVEFNRFNLSLLRRGFLLDGIVFKPIHPENSTSEQVLFQMNVDQIRFTGLWFDFFEKTLTISRIYFDNPNVELYMPKSDDQSPSGSKSQEAEGQESAIKILEKEIKKSLARVRLNGLFVNRIEIDHANVFFFKFLSQSELAAQNTTLVVRDLDWTTGEEWSTPFNAKGFEFTLDHATFPLPDGIHTLSSEKVWISSLDRTIDIRNFSMLPSFEKESKAYYSLHLDRLRVGNSDLNKAFMTSELEIDELIMDQPEIKVVKSNFGSEENVASGDLNDLIKGKLKSISIKELSINNASFLKEELEDSLRNRIQLDALDFKMVGFYLGQEEEKRENQFFYGQDASMEIRGGKLYLGDGIHVLMGEEVKVSSFKDELIVSNLSLLPRSEEQISRIPRNLIRLQLPEFVLLDADLKKLYQTGKLEAGNFLIDQPKIEFTELQTVPRKDEEVAVLEVVAGFLNEVSIKKFQVKEGTVLFKDEKGQRSNNIGFERFSLNLDELHLLPDSNLSVQDQLQVQEIYLALNQYQLKLRDNLHQIFADQLIVDSKRKILEVQNLSIKPENQAQIQSQLDIYGKTSAVEFFVPLFRAENIDVKTAFFDQQLSIGKIRLPNPDFFITTYRSKGDRDSNEGPSSAKDIQDLLLGYFQSIRVDSVHVDQATIRYESLAQDKKASFEENNLTLKLRNFALNGSDTLTTNRSFFSDEVDLTFNAYSFTLAGGKYLAETDYLNYNSLTKTIAMENLLLVPGTGFAKRVSLGLNIPKVQLEGVNMEEFLFENLLNLEKLEIEAGEIEIAIDRKITTASKSKLSDQKSVQKTIDRIRIDTVKASNSILQLNYLGQNQAAQSIKTGFDFLVTQFKLDTLSVDAEDISSIYGTASLDLKDFTFALPDSVHTIQFSNVAFGDQSDEVVFSDLRIFPKDYFGKSGSPVVDAKIDQIQIRKNTFQEILETKNAKLNLVRLVNPVVDLYLDAEKGAFKQSYSPLNTENQLLESILLKDVVLENGKVTFHRKGQGLIPRLNFPQLDIRLSDLGIDLLNSQQKLDLKDLAEKQVAFNLKGYSIMTPDSLYLLEMGSVRYDEGDFAIDQLSIQPVMGYYGYLRSRPYQMDAVKARVEKIRIKGLDPIHYVETGKIQAEEVLLDGAEVDLFRDKRLPVDSTAYRPMPQFLLENSKINADILSFRVRDSRIRYFEFAPKATMPGMVYFDSIRMDMAPFFLRKKEEGYPLDRIRLGIESKLMGKSEAQLEALLYFKEGYPMDVSVQLSDFEFTAVSDFLSKSLFVEATQGKVTQGAWNFRLDEEYAIGEMALGYRDLKIQFLDSLTLEPGRGKLRAYTLAANLFASKSNPRSGSGKLVKREIYVPRDKRKFVIHAWWRSTLSGLRATVGLGRPKVPKSVRKEED